MCCVIIVNANLYNKNNSNKTNLPASDRINTHRPTRHHLFRIPFLIPAALAFYCCTIPSYYFYIHVMCCYLLTEKHSTGYAMVFLLLGLSKQKIWIWIVLRTFTKFLGSFLTQSAPSSQLHFPPLFLPSFSGYRILVRLSNSYKCFVVFWWFRTQKRTLYSNANGYFLNRKIKSIFYQRINIAYVPSSWFATYTFYVVTYVAYI